MEPVTFGPTPMACVASVMPAVPHMKSMRVSSVRLVSNDLYVV